MTEYSHVYILTIKNCMVLVRASTKTKDLPESEMRIQAFDTIPLSGGSDSLSLKLHKQMVRSMEENILPEPLQLCCFPLV